MSLGARRLRNRLLRLRLAAGRGGPEGLAAANLRALDHLEAGAPWRGVRFAVVDLETTGLDTQSDRVVSVGAVRMAEGRIRLGDHFSELINPGRSIPAESIKIHGITPDEVATARDAAQVFRDFLAWLGEDVLVAHYAVFDLHFINFTMRRLYGFPLQNLALDTRRLCQAVVLKSDPYGIGRHEGDCALERLAERFGLDQAQRHTALGDALVTALIFQHLLARMEARRPARLRDLVRAAEAE